MLSTIEDNSVYVDTFIQDNRLCKLWNMVWNLIFQKVMVHRIVQEKLGIFIWHALIGKMYQSQWGLFRNLAM